MTKYDENTTAVALLIATLFSWDGVNSCWSNLNGNVKNTAQVTREGNPKKVVEVTTARTGALVK